MVVRFLPFFLWKNWIKKHSCSIAIFRVAYWIGGRGGCAENESSFRADFVKTDAVGRRALFFIRKRNFLSGEQQRGNDFFTAPMKALTDKLRSQSFLVSATRRRNDNQISHHSDYLIAQRYAKAYKTRINPLPHGRLEYLMLVPRSTYIYTQALFHYILCSYNFADIRIFSMICNWINLNHHRNKNRIFPLVSRRKWILCKLIRFTLSI